MGPRILGDNVRIIEPEGSSEKRRTAEPRDLIESKTGAVEEQERHRRFLLEHEYRFGGTFKAKFRKLKGLPYIKAGKGGGVSEDDLRFKVGEIVYLHHRRYYGGGEYFKELEKLMSDAEEAALLLDQVFEGLRVLDADHFRSLLKFKSKMPPAMAETSVASLFSKVKETSILMSVIQAFLKFITAETSKSDRGRPSLPYIIPTVQLMILWSDLTGRSVVTPKRKTRGAKKSGESEQPSTEFVRLCLSMIDPKVSLSNAETSIKKALPILRRAWKFRAEHPDLNPNDPFDYFWLALADFEGAQIIPKKRTV